MEENEPKSIIDFNNIIDKYVRYVVKYNKLEVEL